VYTLIVWANMSGRKACSGLRGVKLFDTYKSLLYKDIESRFKRCTNHYDRRQTTSGDLGRIGCGTKPAGTSG
jgi:hypothetical protein